MDLWRHLKTGFYKRMSHSECIYSKLLNKKGMKRPLFLPRLPFHRSFRKAKVIRTVLVLSVSLLLTRWIVLPVLYDLVIHFLYIFVLQRCDNGDLLWKHVTFEYIDSKNFKDAVVHCIPSVPDKQSPISWHVPLLDSSLSEQYLQLPYNRNYTDSIVILSPLRDASEYIQHLSTELAKISYPHHLVSVYFGEEGSTDNTFEVATNIVYKLKHKYGFRDAAVYKLPIQGNKSTRQTRHFSSEQIERRGHLAKVRNSLTKMSLTDQKWILWIDSDVFHIRPDIIQQFLFSNKDVMAASALVSKVDLSYFRTFGVYDRNTRRVRREKNGMTEYSIYINDLKAEGREARVDLVGACCLMIRADCVRKGLEFPEKPHSDMYAFEALESEGLGQMATHMKFQVYGLPHLEVYHIYDPPKKESFLKTFFYFIYSLI